MGQAWVRGRDHAEAEAATAAAAAGRGWPAFMSQARLKQAMLRFPADKSLMGTRVRLRQSRGGWVEYRRLPGPITNAATFQRVDGATAGPALFPAYLASWEAPAGADVPHKVLRISDGSVGLVDRATGECGMYRRESSGAWRREHAEKKSAETARGCPAAGGSSD